MKQGSKVHQKLEDEVHTTVEVEVLSKEDGFGLRLWNFIQGMRTLRETGLTRELEVWGLVDGNLVNGVIDSLSHQHPNPEFEVELSQEADEENQQQKKVTDFFQSKPPPKKTQNSPKIYLADVKTRGSLKQVSNVALRPAKIQLLLYHRFLGDIAAGRLDFYKVFRRYGLDPDEPFSDTFIAQMSNMHEEMFDNEPSSSTDSAYTDTANQQPSSADETDALNYRSLRELLPLVKEEVKLALPEDADSLGNMLRVLYIYRDDGREIGHYDFPVSNIVLDDYLSTYMEWWKGERKAVGVDIEEAFKCRTCEFAEVCTWRQNMDDERVRKVQQRLRAAQS
jgi:exonuclease V